MVYSKPELENSEITGELSDLLILVAEIRIFFHSNLSSNTMGLLFQLHIYSLAFFLLPIILFHLVASGFVVVVVAASTTFYWSLLMKVELVLKLLKF